MPADSNYVYYNRSENLSGKPVLLMVKTYNSKTIEIIVSYASEHAPHRRWVLLFLVVIVNLISLIFEVLSTIYCSITVVIVLISVYNFVFTVKQERIFIVDSLGYQIETYYTLNKIKRFIAWQHIKAVFINEVVSKQRVIFILAILTKDEAKTNIIPLFTETMPKLSCLEVMYHYIENCHS